MTRAPTRMEIARWSRIAALGCIVSGCRHSACIHHALTGMGGRKNHLKVLPLCYDHHQGKEGIHTLSRRVWEKKFGTEEYLLEKVEKLLSSNHERLTYVED